MQIIILVLVTILTLCIGYASVTNVLLTISGNGTVSASHNNFNVKFLNTNPNEPTIDESPTNTITINSDTTASFDISTLYKKDDYVIATLKVKK